MVLVLRGLLRRLEDQDRGAPGLFPVPFAAWKEEQRSLPALLARCALRLAVQLAQHNAAMETLLPAPFAYSAAAPREEEAHDAAGSAVAATIVSADPVRDLPLDLAALPLSAARRSLQQALRDVHNTVRSAERRVQIALERQLPPPPPPTEQANLARPAAAADKEQSGWFRQLQSALSFPALSAPAVWASHPTTAPAISEWSAPLSSSLGHDALFVRHSLKQLGRQCDALEALVRRVNAEEGIDDPAELQQHQQVQRDGPELTMVSQHQRQFHT